MSSEKDVRLNTEITSREIRLIGEDGKQVGIVSREEALRIAEEAQLDLVEIFPNSNPPVCRVMDFGKFLFEKSKQKAQQRKKQKRVQLKEVKFRPNTEIGDYQVKLRNLLRFLENGDKVKISVRFRGREIAHTELGTKLIERLQHDVANHCVIEQAPKFEGKQLVMVIAPKKK